MWAQNIWVGVSVESQEQAWRIDELAKVPAAVRFVSAEPLLGPLVLDLDGIDWVIAAGESGPNHRTMEPCWALALRDQCFSGGVAFFFKQWGGRQPKDGGRELDGRTWDALPPRHAAQAL